MTLSRDRSYNVCALKRLIAPFLLLLFFTPLAPSMAAVVIHADIEGAIHGVTSEYVERAIERAKEADARLIIFTMNTPGGLVSATEEIIQSILASRVPVAFLIAPGGASATSAGFYITISSDVAAMAPGTRIGAAHPVTPFGENKKEDIMMQKAENDLAAQARSIAQNRDRNVEIAEKMVRESISLTETEALDQNLIDLISPDLGDLIERLDGETIKRFDGEEVTLDLLGATVERFEMTTRQKILAIVSNPTIAFVLFIVGVLGLYMEFSNPGLILPGVIGGISLLLFAISTQILPLNLFGLLLIGLGIAMLILEIKVTSYGMLTLGGIVAITIGFLTLFEGPIPELRLPLFAVLPASLAVGGIMAYLTQRAIRAQLWKVSTGSEGLAGEFGTALTAVAETGKVFVHGEYWDATAAERIDPGERVRIRTVKDMVVEVEKADRS